MIDWTLLSWAFLAGTAAAVNPCGIAMLPAYLAYYLGREEGAPDAVRGLYAGLLLATGTLATFTLIGLVIAGVGSAVATFIPWAALLVALLLLVAGVATLLGRAPSLNVAVGQAPSGGGARGFFGFGVAYGLASLGCTLPIFMIVVSTVLSSAFLNGLLAFVTYGLGMGLFLGGVSVTVALGKTVVVRWLRAVAPALKYVGGLGLLAAGSYLLYYNLDGLAFRYLGRGSNLGLYLGVAAFVLSLLVVAAAWLVRRDRVAGTR